MDTKLNGGKNRFFFFLNWEIGRKKGRSDKKKLKIKEERKDETRNMIKIVK